MATITTIHMAIYIINASDWMSLINDQYRGMRKKSSDRLPETGQNEQHANGLRRKFDHYCRFSSTKRPALTVNPC